LLFLFYYLQLIDSLTAPLTNASTNKSVLPPFLWLLERISIFIFLTISFFIRIIDMTLQKYTLLQIVPNFWDKQHQFVTNGAMTIRHIIGLYIPNSWPLTVFLVLLQEKS
jgi:hypothetical protein